MSRIPKTPIHLADGSPIAIGALVGKGGEGEVREVIGHPGLVAKLYTQAMSPEREEKLRAMVKKKSEAIAAIAAWPSATLHQGHQVGRGKDAAPGSTVGFLMPRLTGHLELHKLSHPMDRLKAFPEVGYDFLVHVATNIARAFSTLHAAGIVVGDVNESGVMVRPDGTVTLIDCDSMQISEGGRTYPCDVGKPDFQPPEILIHHSSFRGLHRTIDHDAFGLAVLIFQLLFFGWHPYSVRMLDGDQEPTAENIKRGRFAFGRDFYVTDFRRPPHALDPAALPDFLRELIEQAFTRDATSPPRPSADQWVASLSRLMDESVSCSRYTTHVHHRSLNRCPFCDLDRRLGFPILPHLALDDARLAAIWKEVNHAWFELESTTPPPELPLPEPEPVGEPLLSHASLAVTLTRIQLLTLPLAVGLGFVSPALWSLLTLPLALELVIRLKRPASLRELALERRRARIDFEEAERGLAKDDNPGVRLHFDEAKTVHERLRHHDEHRQRELVRLHDSLVDLQLRGFLERHRLRAAGLAAIPGREVLALEEVGLTTANDVTPILSGRRKTKGRLRLEPAHKKALLRWEKSLEARFTPDLEAPTYVEAIDALHRRLDAEHADLLARLTLAHEWLQARLALDRRRREQAIARYRDRFEAYARALQRHRSAAARLRRPGPAAAPSHHKSGDPP